jgi:hypothetical protein
MGTYNGIELTEEFYDFFAPYFFDIVSNVHDPREQDNVNLRYSLRSYLSVIILGLCQGKTSMRQIALLSKDEAFREYIAFLCESGALPTSQNAFTNLTEQLDPHDFQRQYYTIFKELHESEAFAPFLIENMTIGALDGIELHHHLYPDRQNVTPCAHCLTRIHNKGTKHEREECFHRTVVLSLVGQPGSIFCDQEPIRRIEDGSDKGSEKKAAKRLLERLHSEHVLALFDVIVCDALYADADFLMTAASYGVMPVIRIKQENYNIMKEIRDLDQYISFSRDEYDYERKAHYHYRIFEHLTSWKAYEDALCIAEIHEQFDDGKTQQACWVFPQEYAAKLLPALVREIGHLRWQEEINEFRLGNQNLKIKHLLHHEQNSIQIFLFLKLFVLTFFTIFLSKRESGLKKKRIL